MGNIFVRDEDGHMVYDGLLSSKEKASVDEVLKTLKAEIPEIETDLKEQYGNGVLYKYYLGKFLGDLLVKYNILASERRRFWDEIKTFATNENRSRNEGKKSKTRSFYEQCYVLSQYDLDAVKKLSWRQWQDLLDRVENREDDRIIEWLKYKDDKIREDDWREFEKGLHLFLKDKVTSVFTDNEMFEIYDSILEMSKYWRIAFSQFSKDFPQSAKIESKSRRSKKYQETCFRLKRELRQPLNENIFAKAFDEAMR